MEWGKLYPEFERVARREGFNDIAESFKQIAEVEEQHEKRYRKLLKNVEAGTVFKRDKVVKWHCRNCGYVYEGSEAPETCPVCDHPRSYYEVWCENY
jgi:rubrerythrin